MYLRVLKNGTLGSYILTFIRTAGYSWLERFSYGEYEEISLNASSSTMGFPNSQWSVSDSGRLSSSKLPRTSRNGTFRMTARYRSGRMFMQACATSIPPALEPLAANK